MEYYECDVCGEEIEDVYHYNELRDRYKLTNIDGLCDACDKELSDIHHKIDLVVSSMKVHWRRRAIYRLKQKYQALKGVGNEEKQRSQSGMD